MKETEIITREVQEEITTALICDNLNKFLKINKNKK